MRSNFSGYYIRHSDNSGRNWIRGVYCEGFRENWPHYNGTAMYCIVQPVWIYRLTIDLYPLYLCKRACLHLLRIRILYCKNKKHHHVNWSCMVSLTLHIYADCSSKGPELELMVWNISLIVRGVKFWLTEWMTNDLYKNAYRHMRNTWFYELHFLTELQIKTSSISMHI